MTLSCWTSWKTCVLALPLALAAPGAADAVPHGFPSKGIIFVADGAGGQGAVTDGIMQQVNNAQLPLNVQQVYWGSTSEPADFNNQLVFITKGRHLAQRILELRKKCPTAKIYLVGFGAGTTVVLRAAECLPPDTVTHIILMAASVSSGYDLRPALLASCEGIDSFYSTCDDALRCAIHHHGTTDGGAKATTAAGLSGFYALSNYPRDRAIYNRLRQYSVFGSPDKSHHGGHLGYVHPEFLRHRVVGIIETSLINPAAFTNPIPPAHVPVPPPAYPAPAPQYPPPPPTYSPPHYPSPPTYRAPAPQYPTPPAPSYSPPQYPTPQYSPPQYPMPRYSPPQYPMPRYSPPQYPPPQYPTPQTPVPSYPPPPVPQNPAPHYPSPSVPQYSPPQPPVPQPQYPAPPHPMPLPKGPAETCPVPYGPYYPAQTPTPSTARTAIYQNQQQTSRP